MIKMIKWYRIKNLKEQVETMENKILKQCKNITLSDLKEFEATYHKMQCLIAGIE